MPRSPRGGTRTRTPSGGPRSPRGGTRTRTPSGGPRSPRGGTRTRTPRGGPRSPRGGTRTRAPRGGPAKNPDLHGNVPDKSPAALVLIDVINDLEFPDGDRLARHALPMARRLAALKGRARAAGIPAIYVNDNFGKWQSDLTRLLEHTLGTANRGRPMVELLGPEDDDYFVLKPKHSGFFSTTLDILVEYLQVDTLILTGVAANICVLFTAHDAFLRDLHLVVPSDCVASNDEDANRFALEHMRTVLKADTRPSDEIDLEKLKGRGTQGE